MFNRCDVFSSIKALINRKWVKTDQEAIGFQLNWKISWSKRFQIERNLLQSTQAGKSAKIKMISNTNGKRKEKTDNQVDTTTSQDGLNDDLTPDYMNILGK